MLLPECNRDNSHFVRIITSVDRDSKFFCSLSYIFLLYSISLVFFMLLLHECLQFSTTSTTITLNHLFDKQAIFPLYFL
jgi:hypothetical protein